MLKIFPFSEAKIEINVLRILLGFGSFLIVGIATVFVPIQSLVPLALSAVAFTISIFDITSGLAFIFFIFAFLPDTTGVDLGLVLPTLDSRRLLLLGFDLAVVINFRSKFWTKVSSRGLSNINRAIFLFIIFQLLSAVTSVDRWASIKSIGEGILFFFIPYFIMTQYRFSEYHQKKILVALFIGALAIAMLSFVEAAGGINPFLLFTPLRESLTSLYATELRANLMRSQSSFGHPIAFGMYLLIVIPIGIWLGARKGQSSVSFWFFGTCIMVGAMFLTISRGPILGMLVSLIFLAVKSPPPMRRVARILLAVILLGGAALTASLGPGLFVREFIANTISPFSDPYSMGASNVIGRLYLLRYGLQAWLSRPLLGYGPGTSASGYIAGFGFSQFTVFTDIANYYLLLLVENGALGFALAVVLFGLVLHNLSKGLFRSKLDVASEANGLRYALFAVALSVMVTLATVTVKNSLPIYWMLLGIGVRLANDSGRLSAGSSRRVLYK